MAAFTCLVCGVPLRRRWWQRGPLAPVALCSWRPDSARACTARRAAQ